MLRPARAPALALAALALSASAAFAQSAPRTAWGKPDLSGNWSNASLTKLERPAAFKTPTLPEAEARRLAAADPLKLAAANDSKPSDPNAGPPPVGALGAAHVGSPGTELEFAL